MNAAEVAAEIADLAQQHNLPTDYLTACEDTGTLQFFKGLETNEERVRAVVAWARVLGAGLPCSDGQGWVSFETALGSAHLRVYAVLEHEPAPANVAAQILREVAS